MRRQESVLILILFTMLVVMSTLAWTGKLDTSIAATRLGWARDSMIVARGDATRAYARCDSLAALLAECRARRCSTPRRARTGERFSSHHGESCPMPQRKHHGTARTWIAGGAGFLIGFVVGHVTHSDAAVTVTNYVIQKCGGGGGHHPGGSKPPKPPHRRKC